MVQYADRTACPRRLECTSLLRIMTRACAKRGFFRWAPICIRLVNPTERGVAMSAPIKTIVSITPNPALDLGGTVDRLIPDEKNYVHGETRRPGGNGINAARIVHRLGFPVQLTGFLGGGVGAELKGLMDGEELNSQFVEITEPTRISITVSDLASHHQTRLSYSGPNITPLESERLIKYITALSSKSLVIIGGSLPPGISPEFLKEILEILAEKKCRCVIDVPGSVLKEVYTASFPPLFIKPNLIEFQESLDKKVTSLSEVVAAAQTLLPKIPLVCVSSVNEGAVLVTPYGTWFGTIPKVEIRSSVGAGDSMVGAMCTLLNQWDFETKNDSAFSRAVKTQSQALLRWGLAAATATLCLDGTELGGKREIEGYFNEIRIEPI